MSHARFIGCERVGQTELTFFQSAHNQFQLFERLLEGEVITWNRCVLCHDDNQSINITA
jgi:hypothetical protein